MKKKLRLLKLLSILLFAGAIIFPILGCTDCLSDNPWELCILSITAFIALQVYISSCETEEVNMLCKLRELLTTKKNMQIHKALEQYKQQKWQIEDITLILKADNEQEKDICISDVEIYNYLGTLELCKIILDHGIMSKTSFKNQFGYRIYNVIYQKQLARLIHNDPKSWADLISLINLFDDYKRLFKQNV